MKLISHRGNINGPFSLYENEPNYIDLAIEKGYDVEIDVWYVDNKIWLGHDEPQYSIDMIFLIERKDNLWIHTKNFDALNYLIETNLKIFFHEKEKHTIIHNTNLIWSHNLDDASNKSIIPLLSEKDILTYEKFTHVGGICSDYIMKIKN